MPDNVRYLFRSVLTEIAPVVESADDEPEPEPEPAAAEQPTTTPPPSAGITRAPAADQPRHQPDQPRPGVQPDQPRPRRPPNQSRPRVHPDQPRPGADPDQPRPGSQPDQRRSRQRPNWIASVGTHRRAVAAGAKQPARRRLIGAAATLIVVAAAVGTVVALVKHGPPTAGQASNGSPHSVRGTTGRTGAKAITGLSAAAIVRGEAARWIVKEISTSAIIACDDVMCSELFNQGLAASNLLVLSPTAPDPLGADVVVGTLALRGQFGPRLAREYAPTVMASFGAGKSRVDVRVVAPDGAVAYEAALNHDLVARQRFGGVLLRNSRISLSAQARPEMIAGLVDSRLLSMFPVLAGQHPIEILGFYDRAPRSAQGVPMTGAELAGNDTAAGLSADSYLRWLLGFLRGQRAPYRPTSVSTALVGGREVVRVRFTRPSPLGFLNNQ